MARAKLRSAASALCRNDVRMFLDHVVVGQGKIKVTGSKSQIENALVAKMGATEIVPRLERCWCGREDSNFHGLSPTTTSTLRVYQFRHGRTPCGCDERPAGVGACP